MKKKGINKNLVLNRFDFSGFGRRFNSSLENLMLNNVCKDTNLTNTNKLCISNTITENNREIIESYKLPQEMALKAVNLFFYL